MKYKYLGDLTKAIPSPAIGLLASNEKVAEATKAIQREKYRKMILLFDAHNVAHGDWESLCFALAETHVTGFKYAEKKGRKTKWDVLLRAELLLAVEQTGNENISEAIKQIAVIEPWKSHIKHANGASTLWNEYTRANQDINGEINPAKKWMNIVRDARAYELIMEKLHVN